MEREKISKSMISIFTFLMQHSAIPAFVFPKGGIANRSVKSCLSALEEKYGEICEDRIVDFCICQVYAISRFDKIYLNRWNITHSWGKKAIERFSSNKETNRYFEDKWLGTIGTSRNSLVELIKDRKQHPLFRYINPDYEEPTKRRAISTTVGYYICAASTLLWNPLSPSCNSCSKEQVCKERTQINYPELYRIRTEKSNKKMK